jgi:hypothetical protein
VYKRQDISFKISEDQMKQGEEELKEPEVLKQAKFI